MLSNESQQTYQGNTMSPSSGSKSKPSKKSACNRRQAELYVPLKCQLTFTELHSVTPQKIELFSHYYEKP
jgi:hypothetical protein